MAEKTFVERYEELVKENESLKARLVAADRAMEEKWAPPRRIYPIGQFCETFTEGVRLERHDVYVMSKGELKELAELEVCKALGAMLIYKALRAGYVEIGPLLSENVLEARICLVKITP